MKNKTPSGHKQRLVEIPGNDLQLTPQLREQIQKLAQAWAVSPQAALSAVVSDWIDNLKRDPEDHPDALMGQGAEDLHGTAVQSITDLPAFGGQAVKLKS